MAARMPDDTSAEEKSRRIQHLIDVQQRINFEVCTQQIGRTEEVLVESESARDAGCVCGKTGRGHMVNFAGDTALIGQLCPGGDHLRRPQHPARQAHRRPLTLYF